MQKTTRTIDEWFKGQQYNTSIKLLYPSSATGWHCGITTLAPLALRHLLSKVLPLFSWVQLPFFPAEKYRLQQLAGIADHSALAPLALRHPLSMVLPFSTWSYSSF